MEKLIWEFPMVLQRSNTEYYREVPSKKETIEFMNDLIALLFPVTHGCQFSADEINFRWQSLQLKFAKLVAPVLPEDKTAQELTEAFFLKVPSIHEELLCDAGYFAICDPASYCREEVILSYPGYYAITVYRFAHLAYTLGIPILPRILSEHAHSATGIDINPGARIGKRLYIDHGTGIVIGETSVVGDNVTIYQGVTLGATFVDKELKGKQRHPVIEDNVILYAGCTILGGDTVIGHDSVIGGNVWLTESVPPFSKVYHRPEIVIKEEGRRY